MVSLYQILKASKIGDLAAADNMYTSLFSRNSAAEHELQGVPPLNFRSNGQPLIEYEIYGNMQQSGGCGERTANLFDKENADTYFNTTIVANDSAWRKYGGDGRVFRIPCESSTEYTISIDPSIASSVFRIMLVSTETVPVENRDVTGAIVVNTALISSYNFTTLSNSKYILFQTASSVYQSILETLMLNKGSTALPYEPYGYKLPIQCGGVTTNIYIGSQSLRKSLDGSNVYDEISSRGTLIRRVDANGDALATPTTVNITAPTIPTVSGSNTLDVDTIIKPSKVSIKYKGR